MRTNFSKRFLEKLRPREKRYTAMDAETRGLGILVFPSGAKSFFHVRKLRGYPERRTLGTFPELTLDIARGKAGELNGKISQWKANEYAGANPIARQHSAFALGEVVEQYIERQVKPNAKNSEKAARAVNYLVGPYLSSWKNRPLTSIRRKDVSDLLADLGKKRGQVIANRVVQLLRRVFNFAEREEIFTGTNPARGHKLFTELERERYLTGEEMRRVLKALDEEPNADLKDFVYISLFAGARMGDTLSMRWVDADLDRGVWTIPNTTKSGKSYSVPLVPEVVEILRARPHLSNEWVFPSWGKSGHRNRAPNAAWKLLCKRAEIVDFHVHDCRRTYGSWQAEQGTVLHVIGKSLGHSSLAATAIYARLDLTPIRASVGRATDAMLATKGKLAVGAPATSKAS